MRKGTLKTDDSSIRMVVNSKRRIAAKNKKKGIINAHDYFTEGFKLSLKKDKF